MTESEIWKDVVGYEGLYKVSNKGDIYSVGRISLQGRKIGGQSLKPICNKYGYLRVNLCKDGKVKSKYNHRIVAQAFVPNPNNYPAINHKDENKTNNYVENLEWCTYKYNANHGTRIKRITQTQSKKVKAINIKTGEVLTFNSVKEAGSEGYGKGEVSSACRGIYKNGRNGKLMGGDGHTYRGFRWSYEQ